MTNRALTITTALLLAVFMISCQQQGGKKSTSSSVDTHGQAGVQDNVSDPNILQIAIGSKDHTTLVAGVQAAEAENILVNAGPLTVFAPTNAAFDALPEGTLETLLKPENKRTLSTIIYGHAAPSTFKIDLLKKQTRIYMADGHWASIEVRDGDVYVQGAKILGTVPASNGIVHVVDKVLLYD